MSERIEREMHQLEQSLMPLLDRAHRTLVRSLDRLEARRNKGGPQAQVSIRHATQVNVDSLGAQWGTDCTVCGNSPA